MAKYKMFFNPAKAIRELGPAANAAHARPSPMPLHGFARMATSRTEGDQLFCRRTRNCVSFIKATTGLANRQEVMITLKPSGVVRPAFAQAGMKKA